MTSGTFQANLTINKASGSAILGSAFSVTGTATINAGNTLNLAGNNFPVGGWGSFVNNGTLKLTGAETVETPTLGTGSTVIYTATSGTQTVKNWGYKNLIISGVGATFVLPANASGTAIGNLILGPGTTSQIGTTTYVANLTSLGASGNLATLTGGTLNFTGSGKVVANYLNLSNNIATPSTALYYGPWSTVGSGVSGWNSGGIIGQASTSGTFTSSIINLGKYSSFGNFSYNTTNYTGTTVAIKVRTSANADMSGATDWASCSAVASGSALSTDSCATAGQQYIQYQVVLTSPSTSVTPKLDDVSIQYNAYSATGSLISSAYDSGDPTNEIAFLSWNQTTPSGTGVTISLRTAPNSGGSPGTWTDWSPLTNGNPVTCTLASGTVTCPLSAIPATMQDATGDQWFQYKATLTSDGANTPTVANVTIKYVINLAPQFDTTFGTNGVTVSQVSDKTDAHYGQVKIQYKPFDPDTKSGSTANQGHVTPSFQYYSGGTWVNIPSQYLGATDLNNVDVGETATDPNTSVHTAYWNAVAELPNNYSSSMQIQVTADDNELANHLGTAQSAPFALDTKAPVIASAILDADAQALTVSISDDTDVLYRISTTALSTDVTASPAWTDVGAASLSGSIPITITDPTQTSTIYFQTRDPFGNLTSKKIVAPTAPFNFNLKDTSNLLAGDFREFLSWQIYTNETDSTFSHYEIDRATGSSLSINPSTAYSVINTVSVDATNFYSDPPFTLKLNLPDL